MTKRQQRTPQEAIIDLEAKLTRQRLKLVKQQAKADPTLMPLFEDLEDARKDIREARKGLGNGPQSFSARIEKHEAWITKIEDERAKAEETIFDAEQRKSEIESQIAAAVGDIANTSTNRQETVTEG
mgnify:FL=1|jgi:ribosome-binding protein aMBF1 (putative translation factor)